MFLCVGLYILCRCVFMPWCYSVSEDRVCFWISCSYVISSDQLTQLYLYNVYFSLQYCISLNRYPCHIFNHRLLQNYFYICFEEDVVWARCALLLVFISLFSVVWSVCSCYHWHNRVIFEFNTSEWVSFSLKLSHASVVHYKKMPSIWLCVLENTF